MSPAAPKDALKAPNLWWVCISTYIVLTHNINEQNSIKKVWCYPCAFSANMWDSACEREFSVFSSQGNITDMNETFWLINQTFILWGMTAEIWMILTGILMESSSVDNEENYSGKTMVLFKMQIFQCCNKWNLQDN